MSERIIYRTKEGDTMDLVAWLYYGKTAGATESLLDANPGLANFTILPTGIDVVMPVIPQSTTQSVVTLWS